MCCPSYFPDLRNVERGLQAYARTNLRPAGSGIFGGSAYPIDRVRLASLLGFDAALENTRDAVWSEDHTLDMLAGRQPDHDRHRQARSGPAVLEHLRVPHAGVGRSPQ